MLSGSTFKGPVINYGEGVCKTRRGGANQVLALQKGGLESILAVLKGKGTQTVLR